MTTVALHLATSIPIPPEAYERSVFRPEDRLPAIVVMVVTFGVSWLFVRLFSR